MPTFSVTISDFDPSAWQSLSGLQAESCSWARVAHSAGTAGRANTAHVMRHGAYSWFELVNRVAMMLANLRNGDIGDR